MTVAFGDDAIAFLRDPAVSPFPGVPVVFMVPHDAVELRAAARRRPGLPANFTGFHERLAIRETFELALALFPEAEHVALIGGASPEDVPFTELLRRGVAASGHRLDVIELIALPMDELVARVRSLPPRTVVLTSSFFRDGAGRQWSGPQAVPLLSAASSAPIFTLFATTMGTGTVGGVMTDVGETGRAVAAIVIRILGGERVETIPAQESGAARPMVDARQLARWGTPLARVPAGVEVRFREPSLLARYRRELVLASIAFLLQSALIAMLLLERRRRGRAEAKARENLAIVAHMNRVGAIGELVGSLAHEINSPLGAALNNAEAALRLRPGTPAADAELRACLDDIVRDVTRAGEVLRRIRLVLRRQQPEPVALAVGSVIRDALRLVKAVTTDRGIAVDLQVAPVLPEVTGDPVQLSQVILNLLINAIDAVSEMPEDRRRVRIEAEPQGDSVAIRVIDSGPGVPPEVAPRIFDPFFTTKPIGLGMGLAITRSIVEAHGGAIRVSRAPGGGAAFEVLLPAAREAAEARVSAKAAP